MFRHPAMNFTISCNNKPASNAPQAAVTCLLTGKPHTTAEHSSTTSQSDTPFTHLGSNKQDFINLQLQDPTLKDVIDLAKSHSGNQCKRMICQRNTIPMDKSKRLIEYSPDFESCRKVQVNCLQMQDSLEKLLSGFRDMGIASDKI
ncbi:hypothetical protein OS493_024656 [Desmophyllum pertusum]|uniref:Uncharacterized protein n=1 Tax=Desmophyllum pertusum TaxID=174260 RepID=A0A9X0D1R4_9CNID|nr:hypothetical protein OS493_024656 [Desmophyllum pertusum]